MIYPQKLSKYVSFREGVKSSTAIRLGIKNYPNEDQLKAMQYVSKNGFDPIREHFGVPIGVSSFLRSHDLNEAIGGSTRSYHLKGAAIDIDADIYGRVTNAEIFFFILNNLPYSELIWEFGNQDEPSWVHYALEEGNIKPSNVKVAYSEGGRTRYRKYDQG